MPLAVVRPAQRQYLAPAASRQQEKADGRDLAGAIVRMGRQRCRQPPDLLVRQEALAPLPAVTPDAPAGVGSLGPKAHRFRFPHDDRKHRHGSIRRNRRGTQRSEPVPDVVPADVRDPAPGEVRQELIAQIASVHVEGPRLPDPLVTPEHGFGDGFEESVARFAAHILPSPDRGEHHDGSRPRLADVHRRGVADNLPDALPPILAVDEEAFAARGQHPDAEASKLDIAEVVSCLSRLERPDTGLGERGPGHVHSPGCGCIRGTDRIIDWGIDGRWHTGGRVLH